MRSVQMMGLLFVGALTMGWGCQLIAGVPGEVTLDNGAGGSGGSAGNGGVGGQGTSSSSSSGEAGAGGAPECTIAADCVIGECRYSPTCEGGVCNWTYASNGAPTDSQLYGDCLHRECDGQGNVTEVAGDPSKDAYDWGPQNPCYAKACNGFINPTPNDGATCTTSWGNASGQCKAFKCIECLDDTACGMMAICREGRCIANTCEGGVKDGTESDIDCGGADCLPCTAGKECASDADCDSKCDTGAVPPKCIAPSCSDGFKNGDETDVDCGGTVLCGKESPPKKCAVSQMCLFPSDCESGVCKEGVCMSPQCNDFTLNGDETGVDCGGMLCSPCAP